MNKRRIAAFLSVLLTAAAVCGCGGYNGEDAVIPGKDGYLFRARGVDGGDRLAELSGADLYTQDELGAHVSALTEAAGAPGCKTVFVTVPSKAAVYREKLPKNVGRTYSATRRITQLCAALAEAGADVIDLFPVLEEAKDPEQLYHTGADGLNEAGGYRLYEAVASHINEKYRQDKLPLCIPDLSGYTVNVTEDAAYPLCREYRNITGKTVPNRTVTLDRKESYTDAGYDYEGTFATALPYKDRESGYGYPAFIIFGADAERGFCKFFSACSSLAVFCRGWQPDGEIVGRALPDYAVFVIYEDELDALPSSGPVIDPVSGISSDPVVADTAYSYPDRIVIFGKAEPHSTLTVRGGAEETATVRTESGDFAAEIKIKQDRESTLFISSKTDGKSESGEVKVQARYRRSNGYKNVVVGKEGHLHYQDTVPDFTGESLLDDATVAGYVGYLSAKADRIHAVSPETKIIYVIPPNHLTVYPETAPDELAAQKADNSRLSQLAAAFRGSDKLIFLDLTGPLLEAKKTAPYRLYNKTDTHWNELGAYYGCCALLDIIAEDFPAAAPDPLSSFDVYAQLTNGGDMANFLGADLSAVKEEGIFVRAKNGLKSGISKDHSMNFENAWFSDQREFSIDGDGLPTMIMYRDSFSTNMMSFLAEKFSYSIFHTMWEYAEETELYGQMRPDYIIYEFVERGLGGLS